MATAGGLLTLDLGKRTGFADGMPATRPRAGAVLLAKDREGRAVAVSNMIAWLEGEFAAGVPALVVKEAALPLQAFLKRENAEATVRLTYALHGAVEGMCVRFGIRCEDVAVATARKHFLGRPNLGSREDTKLAVVKRCHLLKLLRPEVDDDNIADALCIHDWAGATFFRRSASSKELYFFGEQP